MSVKLDFSILEAIPTVEEDKSTVSESKRYYGLEAGARQKAEQREMYAAYQEAIRKSERLRSEITKGVKDGEKAELLLLKAMECISLMTGDKVFLEVNKRDLNL